MYISPTDKYQALSHKETVHLNVEGTDIHFRRHILFDGFSLNISLIYVLGDTAQMEF